MRCPRYASSQNGGIEPNSENGGIDQRKAYVFSDLGMVVPVPVPGLIAGLNLDTRRPRPGLIAAPDLVAASQHKQRKRGRDKLEISGRYSNSCRRALEAR